MRPFDAMRLKSQSGGGGDPNFASNRMLIHFDGTDGSTTFPDFSPIGTRPTWQANGSAQVDTAQSKWGGASGLFDGSTAYLRDTANQCLLGTGDMTIEAWVRLAATGRHTIVSRYSASIPAGGYQLDIGPSTEARFLIWDDTGTVRSAMGATSLSAGVWYHLAGTIAGTSLRVFVDGSLDGTGTFSGIRAEPSGLSCYIGRDVPGTAGRYMNGWIDDVRAKTGIALYTGNFSPPSAAFPDS